MTEDETNLLIEIGETVLALNERQAKTAATVNAIYERLLANDQFWKDNHGVL